MVNYFEMTRTEYEALFAPAPLWDIPNSDDEHVQVDNIIAFLNENKDTDQQIGFQGDGSGNFYVKAGSFGSGSSSAPDIKSNGGTLIYSAGSSDVGGSTDNYICAAHLGNIMNYILYYTKGSQYGTITTQFPDSGTAKTISVSKGFYGAGGNSSYFYCNGTGYTSYYSYSDVDSRNSDAVWW